MPPEKAGPYYPIVRNCADAPQKFSISMMIGLIRSAMS
jgi:hypothetical protein